MSVSGSAPVERIVGRLLKIKGLTLAVAESCTGGLVGDRITNVPGSSNYFRGGVIAYSDDAKKKLLGVSGRTLQKWGAVSEQTVSEMAAGVSSRLGADVGVSVSGIAAPGGGSGVKPVGLVYICVKTGTTLAVERHRFRGGRRAVKEQSAAAALELCRRVLEDEA